MSSQIHFKFKNARDGDVVLFEGAELPLDALKRAIVEKKGLAASGVDLVVVNAQSGQGASRAAAVRGGCSRGDADAAPSPPRPRLRRAEYAPYAAVAKNASVLVKIKPPPASRAAPALVGAVAHATATTAAPIAGAAAVPRSHLHA